MPNPHAPIRLPVMLPALALFAFAAAWAMPLHAQDEAADSKEAAIDLALAYPSTTMVYGRFDASELGALLDPDELLAGIEAELPLPNLSEIISDRLELNLTEAETRELIKQIKRASVGLLDVGVSGPKLQIVLEHGNPAALARALKQANEEGAQSITGTFEHEDQLVYQVYLPLMPQESDPDDWGRVNPLSDWTDEQDFCVCVFDNRYVIVTNNESAIRDAIDFLAFPDDPIDTLLGNKRYTEALAKYADAMGVMFVNIQAVINAMERVAGDKGSADMFQEMASWWIQPETLEFVTNLLQYEQFKSFAAGIWLDDAKLTLRIDATFHFHHAPAWFNAVRIKPDVVPLTEYIPADAALAFTDCVQDVGGVYTKFRDFVLTRARNAGRTEVVEAWEEFENENAADGCPIDELLNQIGGGQAYVMIPRTREVDPWEFSLPWDYVGLIGLKDRKQAQDFLYERFLPSRMARMLRDAEGDWSPVTIYKGQEVHHDVDGEIAFAVLPHGEKAGVLAIGSLDALKRVLDARAGNTHLRGLATWSEAQQLLWEKQSLGMYLNLGAMLKASDASRAQFDRWGRFEPDMAETSRDDTKEDENPVPMLANFFANTVIVGGVTSGESHSDLRLAAAGWPNRDSFKQLSRHFGDVQRNVQVRDELLRVRKSAVAAWAISGKGAADVAELRRRGLLTAEDAIDPYGPDVADGAESERLYLLAPTHEKLDIRQPVLCAYQAKPGLGGKHLVVLWNNDICKLTPAELAAALKRAAEGLALEDPRYATPVQPLHTRSDPALKGDEDDWVEMPVRRVVIIDKEGNEATEELDTDRIVEETEALLDRNREAGK